MSMFKTEDRPGVDPRFWKDRSRIQRACYELTLLAQYYDCHGDLDLLSQIHRHMIDAVYDKYGMGD